MSNKVKNIFGSTDCLSEQDLRNYAAKKLNTDEMHRIEQHLVDCELCSEAVEGYLLLDNPEVFSEKLDEIYSFIYEKKPGKRTIHLNYWYAAAASILLVAGISVLFHFSKEKTTGILSENTVKYDEIKIESAMADSISLAVPSEKTSINTTDNTINTEELNKKFEQKSSGESSGYFRKENDGDLTLAANQQQYYNDLEKDKQASLTSPLTGGISSITVADYKKAEIEDAPLDEKSSETESGKLKLGKEKIDNTSLKEEAQTKTISTVVAQESKDSRESRKNKIPVGGGEKVAFSETNEKADDGLLNKNNTDSINTIPSGELLSDAMIKYNSGDYSGTIQLLDKYRELYPNDYNTLYYCGVSYYYLKNYSASIECFDKVLKVKNGQWGQQAKWYKALGYIEISENSKAREMLNEIVSENGLYKDKALEILQQLK